jgi:hypothetical protein
LSEKKFRMINRHSRHSFVAFLACLAILANACGPRRISGRPSEKVQVPGGIPDYALLQCWAAHPDKWDPSDSIPKPLRGQQGEKKVAVFFIHPTTFTSEQDTATDNARIDDQTLNEKTDSRPILYQASVFNGSCLVYAPRYRQAHLRMYYIPDTVRARAAFDTAYADVARAFRYFLDQLDEGSPFILASHSQGTTHAKRLLREFIETDSQLRSRLVVAYLLGIAVEKSAYQVLQPCSDSVSTGCYIGWRTYRKGYSGAYVSDRDTTIAVTNPFSWTARPGEQSRHLHQGAVLYNFNKVYRHTHSAAIAGNMLWISRPKFPGGILYATRNYHAGDINLFYLDIRADISRRIDQYFKRTGR